MTTGKTTALTRWTLVGKVMSLPHKTTDMENISVLFNRVPEIPDITDVREIKQKK